MENGLGIVDLCRIHFFRASWIERVNPQGLAVDAAQIFVELEIVSVPIFHGKFLTTTHYIRVDLHAFFNKPTVLNFCFTFIFFFEKVYLLI